MRAKVTPLMQKELGGMTNKAGVMLERLLLSTKKTLTFQSVNVSNAHQEVIKTK